MKSRLKSIKCVTVLLMILFAMILSTCGGNNGNNYPEIAKIEEDVISKAEQLFLDEDFTKFVEIIEEASSEPNYEADLKALNNAMDDYNTAVLAHLQKAQMLLEDPSFFQQQSMKSTSWLLENESLKKMKPVLKDIFGDFGSEESRKAFLNAGMGWSSGIIGGVGGNISGGAIVGTTLFIDGGVGQEITYDFLNFSRYNSTVRHITRGAGISLSLGLNLSGDIFALLYENWIFGFKKDEQYAGGPGESVSFSAGVQGALGAGLGLSGSIGTWYSVDGTCSLLGLGNSPITGYRGKYGLSFANKVEVMGGIAGEVSGSLAISESSTCKGDPKSITNFLSTSDFDNKLLRQYASYRMAADMLLFLSGSIGVPTELLAGAAVILYGLWYDESLIQNPIYFEFEDFIPGIEARPGFHVVSGLALSLDESLLYAAHWQAGTVQSDDPIGVYSTVDYFPSRPD